MYLLIVFIIILVIITNLLDRSSEKFESIKPLNLEYKKIILPNETIKNFKKDNYMNFIRNVNNKLEEKLQTCDNNNLKSDALKFAFEKTPLENSYSKIEKTVWDPIPTGIPNNDMCVNKSVNICEFTDPNLYVTSNQIYFPPRWIGPYKNDTLPKHTDLNCYNRMYNCCHSKNNII